MIHLYFILYIISMSPFFQNIYRGERPYTYIFTLLGVDMIFFLFKTIFLFLFFGTLPTTSI